MKRKLLYGFGIVVALAIIAFAYYAISPLFMHIRVDEKAPMTQNKENPISVPITGTTGHPASGTVQVIEAEAKTYIRYENFKTINGPDLYVYLAKDLDAKEHANLGTLRATEGNVNYEIPSDVNVKDYKYVMVWCKQFGVLFNYAEISNGAQKKL
ncbi:MAG: DM13 domain-containing protein [Candidatus Sungbacteria bacterium]|nr:DM13 domain-containing protein [Candidatus Sungbacteria bacterium]